MEDLLTTRELMELLHLDRTTIYRMLNGGRLPAVRVGGQWRFERSAIDAWLQGQNPSEPNEAKESSSAALRASTDVLPLHCLHPIQEVFAQTAGIGAVTTNLDGEPLTEFSNPCAFCKLILSTDKGRARCQGSWKKLAGQSDPAPRLTECHAGLTYARGRITVQDTFLAMIFSGQFLVGKDRAALEAKQIERVAQACEVDVQALRQAAANIPVIAPARADQLLGLLQMVANTFSAIGQERLELVRRLKQVAEIAGEVAA
ncbi:MAG: PocR ligand-binding domain-containing protein [Anaerolineae bacterium]